MSSGLEEVIDGNMCFARDGARRALCYVPRVTWQGNLAARVSVTPHVVAPRPGAVEGVSESAEAARHLAIPESREPPH